MSAGVARCTGFLATMLGLGVVRARPDGRKAATNGQAVVQAGKRPAQLPRGPKGEAVVHLGADSNAYVIVADGSQIETLETWVHLFRGIMLAKITCGQDILTNDRAYDGLLQRLPGMGPQSEYVRPHVRRKYVYMACHLHPKAATELWSNITIGTLGTIVPDMADVLDEFGPADPASSLHFFGFDESTGPLLVSCWGCLCKPLLQLPRGFLQRRGGLTLLEAAKNKYLAQQWGPDVAFVCQPSPQVLVQRCTEPVSEPMVDKGSGSRKRKRKTSRATR